MLSILRWQETLDLSHNNFTHFSCNMELVWASSLKRLNLSHNKLGSISWNICQLTCLQDLDVSHNSLRRLPNEEFWTCTTLHKLNLSHNKVSSPCSERVKNWVRNATSKLHGIVWRDSIKANKHDLLQVCFYLCLWTIPRAFAFISRTRSHDWLFWVCEGTESMLCGIASWDCLGEQNFEQLFCATS